MEIAEKHMLVRAFLEAGEVESRLLGQRLHDTLSQQLLGITFAAKILARDLEKVDVIRAAKLHELVGLLNDAIESCRELTQGESFASGGDLQAALQNLASKITSVVPCEIVCRENVSLINPESGRQVYRIALEAIENALKFSHASCIRMGLMQANDLVTFEIFDNGMGFEPDEKTDGLGLQNMYFCAETLKGSLRIESKAGDGTKVICTFPNI